MLKLVLISSLVVSALAYGGGGGSKSGYGGGSSSGYGGSSGGSSGGYGGSSGGSSGGYGGSSGGAGQVVQAAVQTRHTVDFKDVPTQSNMQPTTIEIGSQSLPVTFLFRSSSSSLNIKQQHDSAQGSTQETSSEDEPHRLVHTVTKPIIQEVKEVITPMRKIFQEIQPVQEEVLTIVARGQERSSGGSSSGLSGGSSGGFGGSSGSSGLGGSSRSSGGGSSGRSSSSGSGGYGKSSGGSKGGY